MIQLYSSCVLTLFIIRSAQCLDCVKPVASCPCSEEEWRKRSLIYNCTDLTYICMLTFNNTLVEACILDYPIKPAATGCPTIRTCIDTLPLITIEADFTPCPIDHTGCPLPDHSGYSLSKLYQFPECIGRTASSLCSTNGDIIIEEEQSSSLKVVLGVLIPLCVLAFGAIFCYLRRRYQTKRYEAKRKVRIRTDYTQVPISDVEHYGGALQTYDTLVPENANTPLSDAEDLENANVPISDAEHLENTNVPISDAEHLDRRNPRKCQPLGPKPKGVPRH